MSSQPTPTAVPISTAVRSLTSVSTSTTEPTRPTRASRPTRTPWSPHRRGIRWGHPRAGASRVASGVGRVGTRIPRVGTRVAALGLSLVLTACTSSSGPVRATPATVGPTAVRPTPVRPVSIAAARDVAVVAAATTAELRRDLSWLLAHPTPGSTDGLWHGDGSTCVRCAGGLALAAATIGAADHDPAMVRIATTAFDALISAHYRSATGTMTPPMAGETGPDIQTSLFAGELGQAVLELGNGLDAAHRVHYTAVVRSGADFLVRNGNLAWYSNGNLVLANAAAMAAAYALTGAPRYRADYERAWAFAVSPPQTRWSGRGLFYTRRPTGRDGANGAAYLSEQGAGGLGYDPEYTVLQLDTAIRIYLINGDPRARRLAELLLGQLTPRIDRSAWALDTSRGTRHDQASRSVAFRSAAPTVLAATGDPDLAPALAQQVAVQNESIHSELPYGNPGTQYDYGITSAAVVWAGVLVRRDDAAAAGGSDG